MRDLRSQLKQTCRELRNALLSRLEITVSRRLTGPFNESFLVVEISITGGKHRVY